MAYFLALKAEKDTQSLQKYGRWLLLAHDIVHDRLIKMPFGYVRDAANRHSANKTISDEDLEKYLRDEYAKYLDSV